MQSLPPIGRDTDRELLADLPASDLVCFRRALEKVISNLS